LRLRASTIDPNQQATSYFILAKSYVEEREGKREKEAGASAIAGFSARNKML
jgi:hypothetical protein